MFYELLNEDEVNDIENLSKELGTDYGLINKMLPINSWRKIAKDRKILQEELEEEIEELEKQIKNIVEQYENDYDAELEIPEIHGKGISY